MTKLFKFCSFLILAFTLGYTQGWWRSHERTSTPQALLILTLTEYQNQPLLQEILWNQLAKAIPYNVVIEKLPNIASLKESLSANPVKAHLLLLERKELLQLEDYFTNFTDFSPKLIDQLNGDFILEPKGKYFPIFWQNQTCTKEVKTGDLKIWGFVLPRISRRASNKSLQFLNDLLHNPIANKILKLTPYQLTFKKSDTTADSVLTTTLRDVLLFD